MSYVSSPKTLSFQRILLILLHKTLSSTHWASCFFSLSLSVYIHLPSLLHVILLLVSFLQKSFQNIDAVEIFLQYPYTVSLNNFCFTNRTEIQRDVSLCLGSSNFSENVLHELFWSILVLIVWLSLAVTNARSSLWKRHQMLFGHRIGDRKAAVDATENNMVWGTCHGAERVLALQGQHSVAFTISVLQLPRASCLSTFHYRVLQKNFLQCIVVKNCQSSSVCCTAWGMICRKRNTLFYLL